MPLDPQAEALLSSMKEAGAKPFETMVPAEARVAARAFKDLGGPPEDVSSLGYRFIPGPTADLPVRIYRPAGARDEHLPGLVYFHGSGWVVLNIEICDAFNRALANRTGCIVAAVNYQRAPEHKFPIPLDDCYAATRWVFDNAGEVGIDPTRIGVIGDSAGDPHRRLAWQTRRATIRLLAHPAPASSPGGRPRRAFLVPRMGRLRIEPVRASGWTVASSIQRRWTSLRRARVRKGPRGGLSRMGRRRPGAERHAFRLALPRRSGCARPWRYGGRGFSRRCGGRSSEWRRVQTRTTSTGRRFRSSSSRGRNSARRSTAWTTRPLRWRGTS